MIYYIQFQHELPVFPQFPTSFPGRTPWKTQVPGPGAMQSAAGGCDDQPRVAAQQKNTAQLKLLQAVNVDHRLVPGSASGGICFVDTMAVKDM